MTRARKNTITVIANNISGKAIDIAGINDGDSIYFDALQNKFLPAKFAVTSHDHDIGNITLIFENKLI